MNIKIMIIIIVYMFSFFSVPSKAGNISPKIAPWACAIYDASKPFSVIGYGTNEVEARNNVNLKCTRLLLQNKICEKLAICEAQDETKIDAWICVVYNPGAWEGRGASKVQAGHMAFSNCSEIYNGNFRYNCNVPRAKDCIANP